MPSFIARNWVTELFHGTSVTTPSMTTVSGNLLVACIGAFTNTIGGTPITDNKSNTWTAAISSQGATEGWGAIYYAENCVGGSGHTFTFTPTASDFIRIAVIEITGVATSSALGDTSFSTTTGTSHDAGTVTAGATEEVGIGCYIMSFGAEGIGKPTMPFVRVMGFTAGVNGEGICMGFYVLDANESINYIVSTSSSHTGFCGVATFKMA